MSPLTTSCLDGSRRRRWYVAVCEPTKEGERGGEEKKAAAEEEEGRKIVSEARFLTKSDFLLSYLGEDLEGRIHFRLQYNNR